MENEVRSEKLSTDGAESSKLNEPLAMTAEDALLNEKTTSTGAASDGAEAITLMAKAVAAKYRFNG